LTGIAVELLVPVAIAGIVLLLASVFRRKSPAPTSIEPAVIEAFRKTYRQQWLMAISTAVFLVWVFKYPSSGGILHGWLLLVALAVMAWVCLLTYRHWRYPKCGAYLGRNPLYTGQCPNCGTALRAPRESPP
jgi:hypothetical protein